jgi:AmiR/NasT family two-component response regulator
MNLYATEERAFKPEDRHISAQFASQAAIVLANSQAYWDVRNLGEHLAQAMRSRAGIEQAKGILMAAEHCTEDEAFDMMVRASQRENTKLRDIASRIVAATQQPRPAAGLDGGDPAQA